ncbi:MAG: hypothetical protein J2P24_20400, partial [Streptosporangiales bacterium]|nr:hypothetical protein [Streptosporangiales bacterium]
MTESTLPGRRLDGRLRGLAGNGLVPAAIAAVLLGVMLVRAQTPPVDVLRYAGYLAVLVVAPGFVAWRWLVGVGALGEDLATGTAAGLAVELFAYQGAAALGHPGWYVVVPLALLGCGIAVPSLRRGVFRRGSARFGPGASWLTAASVVAGSAFLSLRSFANSPLVDGYPRGTYVDISFQLSLAAEAKHHFPMTTPYAASLPLHYQYFVYEHLAAASWAAGVDLPVVVTRLFVFPLVALGVVLAVVLARRLGALGWLAGTAAVLAALSRSWPASSWNVVDIAYLSPTQAYATALFGALAVALVDGLRGRFSGVRPWALVALLLAASTASKGTVLPLVMGGLAVVLVIALVRRANRMPALVALLLAVVAWAVAYVAVFAGTSLGLTVSPLHLIRGANVELFGHGIGLVPLLLVVLLSWAAPLLGALVLVWLDRLEPATTLVAAMAVGGAVAAL